MMLVPGSNVQRSSRSTQIHCNSVQAWVAMSLPQQNHHWRTYNGWKRHLPTRPLVVVAMTNAESESDLDSSTIDGDESVATTTSNENEHTKLMELVWRYNKKPLLSIGAQKGPTSKHGNSLRELLQHHTTVKVKIQLLFNASNRDSDTQSMQDQMVQVYNQLKEYAIDADPSLQDMELLQVRVNERILLVGLPGTKQRIQDGTYPPPPPPPRNTIEDPTTSTIT